MKIFFYSLMLVGLLLACRETITKPIEVHHISVEQAKELMAKTDNLVILDVRTPSEISEGKIQGAMELDFQSEHFEASVSALPKDVPYLVYCRSGGRSSKACDLMITNGFKEVYELKDGFSSWK